MDGTQAREDGMTHASTGGQYIRVKLLRPVHDGGQARVRIVRRAEDGSFQLCAHRKVCDRDGLALNEVRHAESAALVPVPGKNEISDSSNQMPSLLRYAAGAGMRRSGVSGAALVLRLVQL